MNLDLIFNPRKGKVAKSKKNGKLKENLSRKKSMKKKPRKAIKAKKKNPAYKIKDKAGNLVETIAFASPKTLSRVVKEAKAKSRVSPGDSKITKKRKKKLGKYIVKQAKKMKRGAQEAKLKAHLAKKEGHKVKYVPFVKGDAELKEQLLKMKKGKSMAKKKRKKKKVSKKGKKKASKKLVSKVRRKKRRSSKKAPSAKSSLKRKMKRALKLQNKIDRMKRGQKIRHRKGKKKYITVRHNPNGGSMGKEIKYLQHSVMELGALAAGAAALKGIDVILAKMAPTLYAKVQGLPLGLGKAGVGVAVGALLSQVKNAQAKAIGKGLVAASVVSGTIDAASGLMPQALPVAMSGVSYYPDSGMRGVKEAPCGKADFEGVPKGLEAHQSPVDFGYRPDEMNYVADFNGEPEKVMGSMYDDADQDAGESSMI